jgi:hypothetical protein
MFMGGKIEKKEIFVQNTFTKSSFDDIKSRNFRINSVDKSVLIKKERKRPINIFPV